MLILVIISLVLALMMVPLLRAEWQVPKSFSEFPKAEKGEEWGCEGTLRAVGSGVKSPDGVECILWTMSGEDNCSNGVPFLIERDGASPVLFLVRTEKDWSCWWGHGDGRRPFHWPWQVLPCVFHAGDYVHVNGTFAPHEVPPEFSAGYKGGPGIIQCVIGEGGEIGAGPWRNYRRRSILVALAWMFGAAALPWIAFLCNELFGAR